MTDALTPKNLSELLPLIDNENKRISAGCTDIMVALRVGKLKPKPLIDINGVEDIKRIFEKDNKVYIGSNVAISDIVENKIVRENFPILIKAIESIGSPQIRNRATLGGNIQNASPSGDSILALLLLEAELVLSSTEGERVVNLGSFIKGVGKTDIKNNEFIEYIVIDKKFRNSEYYFEKVGLRSAMVISIASMGVLYTIKDNKFIDVSIALGAVAPKVMRIAEVEEFLIGKEKNIDNLSTAGEMIYRAVSPIDDVRASAAYRRQVCKNLILRLLDR